MRNKLAMILAYAIGSWLLFAAMAVALKDAVEKILAW